MSLKLESNAFGKECHGESLAAVGAIEQISSMLAVPAINRIYEETVATHVPLGSLTVQSMAAVTVAGLYFIAMIVACCTPAIPGEQITDGAVAHECLTMDSHDGPSCGIVHPICQEGPSSDSAAPN